MAFVQIVKHSTQALGSPMKWHAIWRVHSFVNRSLLGQTDFCNIDGSRYSFKPSFTISQSWKHSVAPWNALPLELDKRFVSAFDLSIPVLPFLIAASLCSADALYPSFGECSSTLWCLELSLITCCFSWTCRRLKSSFSQSLTFTRPRQCIYLVEIKRLSFCHC